MVSELKRGFTSALLELSHIQHGDTHLREELEENRRSCQKKAAHLELLVDSLRVRAPDMSVCWCSFGGETLRFVLCHAGGAWSVADSHLPAGQSETSAGGRHLQTEREVKTELSSFICA